MGGGPCSKIGPPSQWYRVEREKKRHRPCHCTRRRPCRCRDTRRIYRHRHRRDGFRGAPFLNVSPPWRGPALRRNIGRPRKVPNSHGFEYRRPQNRAQCRARGSKAKAEDRRRRRAAWGATWTYPPAPHLPKAEALPFFSARRHGIVRVCVVSLYYNRKPHPIEEVAMTRFGSESRQ